MIDPSASSPIRHCFSLAADPADSDAPPPAGGGSEEGDGGKQEGRCAEI